MSIPGPYGPVRSTGTKPPNPLLQLSAHLPAGEKTDKIRELLFVARRVFIGRADWQMLSEIRDVLDAHPESIINTTYNKLADRERAAGGLELDDILKTIQTTTNWIIKSGASPDGSGADIPVTFYGTRPITEPLTPMTGPTGATTTMTSPIAAPEAPTIAKPEMDLSVPRDKWPWIIRNTKGHLLAYGHPGTGKSYDFAAYAKEMSLIKGVEYEEVNCTRQTSAAGWIGHWIDGKDGFIWSDGPVARAMKAGVPMVINDVHLCSDDLFDLLFFVLDMRPGARLSLNSGEHLQAQDGFRALLSMNGDPLQVLDEPIRDRIVAKFEINEPSKAAIKALDSDVRALCRHMYKTAGPSGPRYTYRTFQNFCSLRLTLGDPFMAARLACEDEERARAFLEPLLVREAGE